MEANSTLGKQFHKLSHIKMPNKLVNMPDRIRKCLGYGRYGQRVARIGPDPMRQVRLPASISVPVFSEESLDHTAQNRRGSDLDGQVRVWPNSSGLKARRCACRNHRTRLRTGPQTRLRSSTDVQDNIIQNQPGPDLVLADCARFWPVSYTHLTLPTKDCV